MPSLRYEATDTTPMVLFDDAQALLEVHGESYPENALDFYRPLLESVRQYLEGAEPVPSFAIRIDLAYLNTSSVKALMDLLDMAEEAYGRGAPIVVTWVYDEENDRSLEVAETFREDLSLPFALEPIVR